MGFIIYSISLLAEDKPVNSDATVKADTAVYEHPYVVIPKAVKAPPVTGDPSGAEWERAAWVGNPVYLNAMEVSSKLDMRAGLLWDDEALYVGFKIKGFRKPLAITTTQGDDGLERDDAVEVCFKVPGFNQAEGQPVQFKLNCAGQRDDAIHFNFKWNAKWDGAVKQDGKNWSATFRIPFANFGVKPKVGDRWEANLGAYLVGYNYRAFLWSPVGTGHHHGGDFGTFEFGDEKIPSTEISSIREIQGGFVSTGKAEKGIQVRLLQFPETGNIEKAGMMGTVITDFDPLGRGCIKQQMMRIETTGRWESKIDGCPAGNCRAKIAVLDIGGRILNLDVKPFRINRSIEISTRTYPVAGKAMLRLKVFDMGRAGVIPDKVILTVKDGNGKAVHSKEVPITGNLPFAMETMLESLKNGETYEIEAKVSSTRSTEFLVEKQKLLMPVRPSWADNTIGDPGDKVLKPYTPLKVEKNTVECWGRNYEYGQNLVLTSLESQSRPVLAGPIRILLGAGDSKVTIEKTSATSKLSRNVTGSRVDFQNAETTSVANVATSGSIEYDGFMDLRIKVTPLAGKKIDHMALEIPMDAAFAQLIQPLPKSLNRDEAGAIPEKGLLLPSSNTLWICNDDTGLYFVIPSTENWNAPEGKAAEIRVEKDKKTLVFHFQDDGTSFEQERNYRICLMATPMRQFSTNFYAEGARVMNGYLWGHNVQKLEADAPALTVPLPETIAKDGEVQIDMVIESRSDLGAIVRMGYKHPVFSEKIMSISGGKGALEIGFVISDTNPAQGGIFLSSKWGKIGKKDNANWSPKEPHQLTLRLGETTELLLDGKSQGSIKIPQDALTKLVLQLGGANAHASAQSLKVVLKNGGKEEVLLDRKEPIDLQSGTMTLVGNAAKVGAKTLIRFEDWCHAQNGGRSKYEPVLKTMVDDAHRAGLKVIFYFGFEIADLPEHQDFLEECKCIIDRSANYYAPQKQNTYLASYGSPYQEYLLYNMKRLKDEIGIDGVYLDGTLNMQASDNPAFGCGYVDAKGIRIPTVPVDRIRRFAKCINNIFAQDGGIVFAHMGSIPPTVSFITCRYLGEHVGLLNTDWKSVSDRIPYDVSRDCYSGRNLGVPTVLCLQNMWPHLRKSVPHWYPAAASWCDLHGIGMNMLLEEPFAKEALDVLDTYKRFTEFGVDTAEFIPYWKNEGQVTLSPDTIKMTVHRRKDGAMICVVANTGDNPVTAKVQFKTEGSLALKADAKCRNLKTGEVIPINNNALEVPIPGNEHRLLVLE